ncbi:unnamed protein product, partial [Mesorhabditis spiculigera]
MQISFLQNQRSLRLPGRSLEISREQAISSFKHCVDLVKTHDFDNYIGALFSPKYARAEIFSVLALNGTTGIYRLQFWKDTLASIFQQTSGPIPRQPIAVALCAFCKKSGPDMLQNLVSARQRTIGDKQFQTVQEATAYGADTWGSILKSWVGALSKGQADLSSAQIAAEKLGIAFSFANVIRSSLPLLSRGIVLLPADLCSLHSVTPDALYRQKKFEDSKLLIRDIAQLAQTNLNESRKLMAEVPAEVVFHYDHQKNF